MNHATHVVVQEPVGSPWRDRDRQWVWLAATTAFICLLCSAWPSLDLQISALFFDGQESFVGNHSAIVMAIYEAVPWLGRVAGVVALLVALCARWRPHLLGVRWSRRAIVLGVTMALGTGLIVNGVFKENWGRARPRAVQAFGGNALFTPALQPATQCQRNCSFVSGHAATGFSLMALGLFGSVATRRRWLGAGMVAGLLIGGIRIAQGGHFLSDVLFSAVIVWLCCAALRELGLLLRLRRQRRFSSPSLPARAIGKTT